MKIAINTLPITPNIGGPKTYLVNLIKHLAEIDKKNIYYLFVSPINRLLFKRAGYNFKEVILPIYSDNRLLRVLYEQLLIPLYVRKYRIDILFCPGNIGIFWAPCKLVVTIHDLHYQTAVKSLDASSRWYYRLMLPMSTRCSDCIIVPSNATKCALLERFTLEPCQVQVVYEGVDLSGRSDNPNMNDINVRNYILFVSTLYPHKNVEKLILAYAEIKDRISNPVVIVGRDPGGRVSVLKRLVSSLGVASKVHFMGRVDHVERFYRNAIVFVYPSEQEGFGLPLLEAMAHGVAVIGSNRGSVPEVIGNAGLVVDPDNIYELAEAIFKMVTDEGLRRKFIRRGFERIKQFSWEKTAKETQRVFEKV